jgi:hypothetical protein
MMLLPFSPSLDADGQALPVSLHGIFTGNHFACEAKGSRVCYRPKIAEWLRDFMRACIQPGMRANEPQTAIGGRF